MTLGEKIQALRKQAGLSQEALAEQVCVTRQTISKWELDQSTPDLDLLARLSGIFQVSTDYLIKPELTRIDEQPVRKKSRLSEKLRPISLAVLSALALAAVCICLICDYCTSERLSWSWIAVAAILAGWCLVLPLLTAKGHVIGKTLTVASLVPFPLLAVLAYCLERPLVFTLGSCIALVSAAALWLIYGLFHLCRGHIWRGLGLALLVLIPLPIAIMLLIAGFIPQAQLSFDSSIFNSAITLALAIGCFGLDRFLERKDAGRR